MSAVSKVVTVNGLGEEAEQQLRDLVILHQDLWNRHDAQGMTELFTENADLVNVIGVHCKGKAEIFQEYDGLHKSIMRNSNVRMKETTVKLLSPEIAVVHVKWEMTGVEKVPGWNIPDIRRGVITYVAVKHAAGWKFQSFHNTDAIELTPPPGVKGH